MANPFVHLELNTPDTAKTKEFYGKLFGWTFQDNDMGDGMVYSMFKTDGGPGGGIYTHPGAPNQWLAYVGVDDIHAATAKARSLGAKVEVEAREVPHTGWFTVLTDPTGATLALWQPMSK